MPPQAITPQGHAELRRRAATRLNGNEGAQGVRVSASEALGVLHDLAAKPDTAADALALLHELQVHQVEVDMQAEALSESRAELESALRRQVDLYDALPVACFTIDRQAIVHELNLAAARMLGVVREEAVGLALDAFLTPECERAVREVLSGGAPGRAAPEVHLMPRQGAARRVRAHVGADPAGQGFLLVLADAGDE
jgi:PAS domain S-box-containing protein